MPIPASRSSVCNTADHGTVGLIASGKPDSGLRDDPTSDFLSTGLSLIMLGRSIKPANLQMR